MFLYRLNTPMYFISKRAFDLFTCFSGYTCVFFEEPVFLRVRQAVIVKVMKFALSGLC